MSRQPWASPTPSAATPIRPPSRIDRKWRTPSPRGPSSHARPAQRDAGPDRHGDGRIDPRQLLDGQGLGERPGPEPAVVLREREAHDAERAELADGVERKGVLAVPGLGVRRDLLLGELPDGRLQLPLLVGQLEVHDTSLSAPHPSQAGLPSASSVERLRALYA